MSNPATGRGVDGCEAQLALDVCPPLAAVWVFAAGAENDGAEATGRGTDRGPPSLRDLRPSLTVLDLYTNGIASVPTEIAPLTGLQDLTLALNLNGLTGFPMATPHHVPDLRSVALLRLV